MALTRCTSDRIVDPQQRHSGLERTLETLDLTHRRLQHARGDVVPNLAVEQVQAVAHVLLLPVVLGRGLRRAVRRAQLAQQLGAVLGRVHRERFRDDEQRVGELCDGELFARRLVDGGDG